jgi:hypothetical protein
VAGAPSLGGIVRVLRVAAFAAYDVAICVLDKAKDPSPQSHLHERSRCRSDQRLRSFQ